MITAACTRVQGKFMAAMTAFGIVLLWPNLRARTYISVEQIDDAVEHNWKRQRRQRRGSIVQQKLRVHPDTIEVLKLRAELESRKLNDVFARVDSLLTR